MMPMVSASIDHRDNPVFLTRSGWKAQLDQRRVGRDDDAPVINADTFNEIMDVIGPRGRDEFIDYLVRDLRNLAAGLDRAIETRDAQEAQEKAHSLIGLAGTVGATRLHALATTLQREAANGSGPSVGWLGAQTVFEVERLIRFCLGANEAERLA